MFLWMSPRQSLLQRIKRQLDILVNGMSLNKEKGEKRQWKMDNGGDRGRCRKRLCDWCVWERRRVYLRRILSPLSPLLYPVEAELGRSGDKQSRDIMEPLWRQEWHHTTNLTWKRSSARPHKMFACEKHVHRLLTFRERASVLMSCRVVVMVTGVTCRS